jgi:hypothetical protein
MYTPEIITELNENEVFVFGTNQYGRHGAGAAKIAVEKFGASYNVPIGLKGQSYGIITTSFNRTPVSIYFIREQVTCLYRFAALRPDLKFYVTKIGCGLAGFSVDEMAEVFFMLVSIKPSNIILPAEFSSPKIMTNGN